jgi:hypothetical protein
MLTGGSSPSTAGCVYKEVSWLARIAWLVAILLLGNIAMAIYVLIQLIRVPLSAKVRRGASAEEP